MDVHRSPLRPGPRPHRSGVRARRAVAVGLVLLVALVAAGCGGSSAPSSASAILSLDDASPGPGLRGTTLATPLAKPAVDLTDMNGHPYQLRTATAGKLTLVYFGYTHCPDVCPTTMADIAAGLNQTSAAVRRQVAVVFVTTDPDRDTPAVLRSWLTQFDPTFVGLTGTTAQITGYAETFGIPVEPPRRGADGSWVVDHGSQVTAFNPDGLARTVYLAGVTPADYAHDIPMLLKGA
ncbi:SCO family protein [Frankia sp. AgB32]|uniref:SCO family protein n=1 Tax=Frankia sp. AgB32 TaxID=631119 RepID=UPI00200C9DBE|nr:SCO family protein [Frankia sp. AgB32]MCK9897913.1 SCO family protein [Frankia sp. AgB32]